MASLASLFADFIKGFKHVTRKHCNRADKKMRAAFDERRIDKMVESSFPASDPPSTY